MSRNVPYLEIGEPTRAPSKLLGTRVLLLHTEGISDGIFVGSVGTYLLQTFF